MKTFDFTVERKVTAWEILKVSIDAESEKEAIEKCKNENYDCIYTSDIDYNYMDLVDPSDNEHNATFIISQDDGTVVYENGL